MSHASGLRGLGFFVSFHGILCISLVRSVKAKVEGGSGAFQTRKVEPWRMWYEYMLL